MKRLTTLMLCAFAAAASAEIPLGWAFEASRPTKPTWEVYHGESVTLEPTILVGGVALSYPTNTAAALCYQTNGMGSAWWSTPAVVTTNSVSAVWSGSFDIGASAYTFFFKITYPDGAISYRANGSLKMLDSPGFVPNAIAQPVTFIDFSAVAYTNEPWATPADLAAIVEEDPAATPIAQAAHTAATNAQAVAASKVPLARTVNGKALSANIALAASDVAAVPMVDNVGVAPSFRAGGGMLTGSSYLRPYALTIGDGHADFAERINIDDVGITMPGYFRLLWPTTNNYLTPSSIATLNDIDEALGNVVVNEADPLSLHKDGGTMTGGLTLSGAGGVTWQGVGIATNYTVKAEFDGTNINFNVYSEAKP